MNDVTVSQCQYSF